MARRRRNPPLVEIDSYSRPRVYVSTYDKDGRSKKAVGTTGRERYYRDLEKAIEAEEELLAGASAQARRAAKKEADNARKAWATAGRAIKKPRSGMVARFPGTCSVCGGAYAPGSDEIDYTGKLGARGGKLTAHVRCIAKKNPTFKHPVTKRKFSTSFYPTHISDSLLEADEVEAQERVRQIREEDSRRRQAGIDFAARGGYREYDPVRGKWVKRHIEGPTHRLPNPKRRGKRGKR